MSAGGKSFVAIWRCGKPRAKLGVSQERHINISCFAVGLASTTPRRPTQAVPVIAECLACDSGVGSQREATLILNVDVS